MACSLHFVGNRVVQLKPGEFPTASKQMGRAMTVTNDQSTELMLVLTERERVQLLSWLQQIKKDKLIEEHRTRTPEYREFILTEEEILSSLIGKLSRT
jgi:hypothetical protein